MVVCSTMYVLHSRLCSRLHSSREDHTFRANTLNIGKGVTIYDIEHNFSVELNKWQCVAPQYCAAVALPS